MRYRNLGSQRKKENALYLSVNVFSTKVLIGHRLVPRIELATLHWAGQHFTNEVSPHMVSAVLSTAKGNAKK